MKSVKYKKWLDRISRIPPVPLTRYGKMRLDKNERVTPFADSFLKTAIQNLTSEQICAYPEVRPLYEKIARFAGVDTKNLIVTPGADGAIKYCFEVFVSPGGKVVTLDPTFAMVDVYCKLFNAVRAGVSYNSQLKLDLAEIIEAIDASASLVIIANPNSPTGTVLPEESLCAIIDRAAHFNIPVLIDEAYYGFCEFTAVPLLRSYHNLIICRSFSKSFGLAGLRIGYIISSAELIMIFEKFRPLYEVNQVGVILASSLLDNFSEVQEYIGQVLIGKQYLLEEISSRGFPVIDTKTNFINADFGAQKLRIQHALLASNILVFGGIPLRGYERYLRISVGPKPEMESVVRVIAEAIE